MKTKTRAAELVHFHSRSDGGFAALPNQVRVASPLRRGQSSGRPLHASDYFGMSAAGFETFAACFF